MSFDIQGHRGARGLLPENSLPAFRRALELDVDTLELDVVISRDEKVVVSHDPVLASHICRLPDGRRITPEAAEQLILFDLDYEDICRYDCGSVAQERFPRQRLRPVRKPLLADVFAMAEEYVRRNGRRPVRYNIETKCTVAGDRRLHPEPDRFVSLLVAEIVAAQTAERTTIQSFDPRTLKVARDIAPTITLSILIAQDGESLDTQLKTLEFVPQIVSPDYHLVDQEYVRTAHETGMSVLPWTVNEPDDMLRMEGLGVHGIITDYPDVAAELFRDRR